MINTSPNKYLHEIPHQIQFDFGDWYKKHDVPVSFYWILIQVYRFLKESQDGLKYLKSLIDYAK